jgi:hypothetical protein
LVAGAGITWRAPHVLIEATTSIVISSDTSTIRLDADGVEILGTTVDAGGASIVANKGPLVGLNS